MKAITLWQPWASFLVVPLSQPERPKKHETRPRNILYRGPLAIHSAKREPKWVRDLFLTDDNFRAALRKYLAENASCQLHLSEIFDALPRGQILGRVNVVDSYPTEKANVVGFDWLLGDFSPGRHAILTMLPQRLITPVPWRGAQGQWNLPDHVLRSQEWEGM